MSNPAFRAPRSAPLGGLFARAQSALKAFQVVTISKHNSQNPTPKIVTSYKIWGYQKFLLYFHSRILYNIVRINISKF